MLRHPAELPLGLTTTLLTEQERKLLLSLIPQWQEFGKSYQAAAESATDLRAYFSVRSKISRILKPPSFGIRFDELEEALTTWREAPSLAEPEKSWDALSEVCQKGIKLKQSRNQPSEGESFLYDAAVRFKESAQGASACILRVLADALSPTSPIPSPFFHQETKNEISVQYLCYMSGHLPIYGFMAKPVGKGPFPIVVVGHDGFWGLNPFSLTAVMLLAGRGFLALAPEFRGQGMSHGIPDMAPGEAEDIQAAVAYLVEKEEGDAARVFFLGEGTGGMASFVAAAHAKVQGVILLPCILDLLAFWNALQKSKDRGYTWQIATLLLCCGGSPDQFPDAYRKRSPIQYLDRFQGDLLMLFGDSDPILPATKIVDAIRDLKSFQTHYKLVIFGKGDHTLHLGPNGQDIWESILHFLSRPA